MLERPKKSKEYEGLIRNEAIIRAVRKTTLIAG